MTSTSEKPLLVAASGKKPTRTPLWLMRQAGRYLPEYRAIREKHKTLTMFQTPNIAAEITLQPLKRFDLDAAILYADILLIPDALGMGLSFVQGEGPKFLHTVRSETDLAVVKKNSERRDVILNKLNYVNETLSLIKPQLAPHVTLIGFAGAPFTVASYLVEGGSAHGEFLETKKLMFTAPHVLHGLLEIITDITIDYLDAQVKHGAEILQLFESWGGALAPKQYAEFCAPYSTRIMKALMSKCPMIHFVGESAGILEETLKVPSNVYGVDWRQDLARASTKISDRAIQGNLDPLLLYAKQNILEPEVERILEVGTAHERGFIFNLGHGINKDTPIENVDWLVKKVHRI